MADFSPQCTKNLSEGYLVLLKGTMKWLFLFMLFFYPIAKVDVIWTSAASCIRNTSSHHLNFSFFFLPAASLC